MWEAAAPALATTVWSVWLTSFVVLLPGTRGAWASLDRCSNVQHCETWLDANLHDLDHPQTIKPAAWLAIVGVHLSSWDIV